MDSRLPPHVPAYPRNRRHDTFGIHLDGELIATRQTVDGANLLMDRIIDHLDIDDYDRLAAHWIPPPDRIARTPKPPTDTEIRIAQLLDRMRELETA